MTRDPQRKLPVRLVRFKGTREEREEFYRQRILCGWAYDKSRLESAFKLCESGDKLLFWIFPEDKTSVVWPSKEEERNAASDEPLPPPNFDFRPLGHVALDLTDYQGDESVASKSKATACFATLFVLVSQQSQGIGRAALQAIENLAKSTYNIKILTINTLPTEVGLSLGNLRPTEIDNVAWYQRNGYVEYKRAPRYPVGDGTFMTAIRSVTICVLARRLAKHITTQYPAERSAQQCFRKPIRTRYVEKPQQDPGPKINAQRSSKLDHRREFSLNVLYRALRFAIQTPTEARSGSLARTSGLPITFRGTKLRTAIEVNTKNTIALLLQEKS